MNIQYEFILPGSKNRPDSRTVTHITIHETDNKTRGANADAHAKYLATTKDSVSWHYSVSDSDVVCHIPPGETAWHSGTTQGNQFSIGIEMCVNSDGNYEQTLKTTVSLVRLLMESYKVPIERVVQHNYWNGKNCPSTLRNTGRWEEFLNMIQGTEGSRTYYELKNNIHFKYVPIEKFKVLYWDAPKRTTKIADYLNGGFFGVYAEAGVNFTLPVANLIADIDESSVFQPALKYLKEWGSIYGGKFYCDCRRNVSKQFVDKTPSTLFVFQDNRAVVLESRINVDGAKYAISGAPVIRNGKDVSWSKDVTPQGWLADIARATWHTFVGIKDGYIALIGMKTTTSNCISSSEAYNKLKNYGFTDVILLDGGGSFIFDNKGKNVAVTDGNRRVNTLLI